MGSSTKFRYKLRDSCRKPDVLHHYMHYKAINKYLDFVAQRFTKHVSVLDIGKSYEGRVIRAVVIDCIKDKNLTGVRARPLLPIKLQERDIVFIEGGAHAREWMSISAALNCIQQLTEHKQKNADLLRKLRFMIVPLVNPDGYEYSLNENRNWRKNRRVLDHSTHIGADCNRNYDFHWKDGSSNKHENTYRGDHPFSEPETQALRNLLHAVAPELLMVITLHSCAQSIMYPWGYSNELPEGWENMQAVANVGRNAFKSHSGRVYRTGTISHLQHRSITGSIADYVFAVLKVPLPLVLELPSSKLGFHPPASDIRGIANEVWFGMREMCKCAYNLRPKIEAQKTLKQQQPLIGDSSQKKNLLTLNLNVSCGIACKTKVESVETKDPTTKPKKRKKLVKTKPSKKNSKIATSQSISEMKNLNLTTIKRTKKQRKKPDRKSTQSLERMKTLCNKKLTKIFK